MRSFCPDGVAVAPPAIMPRALHDLVRRHGGWGCARCGLAVAPKRRAAAARARCPVSDYHMAGAPCPDMALWIGAQLRMLPTWAARARGRQAATPLLAPELAARPAPALAQWRDHVILEPNAGRGKVRCLYCAQFADAAGTLRGMPCTRVRGDARACLRALRGGGYDRALATLRGPDAQAAATTLGLTPAAFAARLARIRPPVVAPPSGGWGGGAAPAFAVAGCEGKSGCI